MNATELKMMFPNASRSCVEANGGEVLAQAIKSSDEGREVHLHNTIIRFCRSMRWPYVHSSMAKATHATLGTPDFIILQPGGKTLLVECKTMGGRLSKDQETFRSLAATVGHTVHIVRSEREFAELI